VQEKGTTPLYIASEKGYLDIVQLLLDSGAAINVLMVRAFLVSPSCSYPQVHPVCTPLEQSCESDACAPMIIHLHYNYTGPLLFYMCQEDGWIPLHVASFDGHAPVVSLLVARGADVNCGNVR
jgi:ankyrin repeat protein